MFHFGLGSSPPRAAAGVGGHGGDNDRHNNNNNNNNNNVQENNVNADAEEVVENHLVNNNNINDNNLNNNPRAPMQCAPTSATTSQAKDKVFVQKYLTECDSYYSCIHCRTHVANHDNLISRSFQGNSSRAYLFNEVINIQQGPSVQRDLTTGVHVVADLLCANCRTIIGWKYEKAYVPAQKYKEGKYIIELAHVVREYRHSELDKCDILQEDPMLQQLKQKSNGLIVYYLFDEYF